MNKETIILRGREEVEKFYREEIFTDFGVEDEELLQGKIDEILKYPDGFKFGQHYFPKNYLEGQPHKSVKVQVFHNPDNQ